MSDKAAKRVVHAGEYLRVCGVKVSLATTIVVTKGCMYLAAAALVHCFLMWFVMGFGYACRLVDPSTGYIPGAASVLHAIQASLLATVALVVLAVAVFLLERRKQALPQVALLTRATQSQLPVEESLVRASGPAAAPSETLLRAAASADETPAEQLLRTPQ